MSSSAPGFDLVVVGAGIVGLGHAAAALERGLRVAVVERAGGIVGASVRNFGHVGVGAHRGEAAGYAARTRAIWLRLAERAGFWVRSAGALAVARHDDEAAVLAEAGVRRLLSAEEVQAIAPVTGAVAGALLTDDLQVDPRSAAPAIAAYLASSGVSFHWATTAFGAEPGTLHTSRGSINADAIVFAVNFDVDGVFPDVAAAHGVQRCGLDMLLADGVGLALPLLTGSSMLRYGAFAQAPSLRAVRERIAREQPDMIARAVNQMYTERPDGTLVIGDTHRADETLPPFQDEAAFDLLLHLAGELFDQPIRVRERWLGVYATAPTPFLRATPMDGVRVVSVTSGIGMTTGLGLAESVIDELWG